MSDSEPNDRGIQNLSRRSLGRVVLAGAGLLVSSRFIKAAGTDPTQNSPAAPIDRPSDPDPEIGPPVKTIVPVVPSPTVDISDSPTVELDETLPYYTPDIVHDVEVYGLGERLTNVDQIKNLYGHLDQKFIRENGLPESVLQNKMEERQNVLPKEDRYLEVVVRRSAYESFLKRQGETHVDFVEWIKMHTEAMNMCLGNAKPRVDMKAVLRRIVVIEDQMPKTLFEKVPADYDSLDPAHVWRNSLVNDMPLNTDCSWMIDKDYRVDQVTNEIQGYFWSVKSESGKTSFYWPPGATNHSKIYSYPDTDLTTGKNGTWLDFGLTHEWLHYLCNGPDQYMFDIHNIENSRIKNAFVVTGNSFQEPNLSPYLAWFLNANVYKKDRRSRDDPFQYRGHDLFDRPNKMNLNVVESGGHVSSVGIRKVHVPNGYLGEKTFGSDPDHLVLGDETQLPAPLFETDDANKPHVWMIRVNTDGGARDIYLPSAAFQMSKFAGLEESANYTIELLDDDSAKITQLLEIVDETDFDIVMDKHKNEGHVPYAKMKVDGTTSWFIWYLS